LAEAIQPGSTPAEAEDYLVRAVELQKKLAAEPAAQGPYRFFLAHSLHELAKVQVAREQWPQARATLEDEIATSTQAQSSAPPAWHHHGMQGMQYALLAQVLRKLGENRLADEAAAKAQTFSPRRGPSALGSFRRDHERMPERGPEEVPPKEENPGPALAPADPRGSVPGR
jgi:hypothetical protein